MKCPKCGRNQKVKDGLTCGGCQYRFSFNPKESPTKGVTDGKFEACIQAASQKDTAYFTRNQLYAVYCRKMNPSPLKSIAIGAVLLLVSGGFAMATLWPFAVMALIVAVAKMIGGIVTSLRKISPGQFDALLNRWHSNGKRIDKLIDQPTLHEPPPDWSEPDIYDYGVERLLIVERDLLVDLFVKNGVHAEQRMLVISESGYPDYLLPVATRLLQEQPDLPVFLLHDATTHGAAMEDRVTSNGLLPLDGHPLTDLGMFPTDFQKLKRVKRFDPNNEHRTLPVDAMLLPFMTVGLGVAMTENIAMSAMLDQQQRAHSAGGFSSYESDFG